MRKNKPFSCYIIGEETMPIQCAELLLERGHTIYGMISPDEMVKKWAAEKQIPFIFSTQDISTFLNRQPFDYLFSIVNGVIIPTEVLALPRQYAINYHDSLLPRYAGNYATSWAIMNEETSHGISWHVMVERVDAGDILKQRQVEISPTETALSLNAKCYDIAISAFAELIDDLGTDRIKPRAQDLSERTFFSFYKRPSAGGLIDWRKSAKSIFAFIRALQFGPYPNFLGLPKIALQDDRYLIVQEAKFVETIQNVVPGTIVQIRPGSIQVATSSGLITLHKLLTIDGVPISLDKAVIQFGFAVGYQFQTVDESFADKITTFNHETCKKEVFWVQQLGQLSPLTMPYALPQAVARKKKPLNHPQRFNCIYHAIPDNIVAYITAHSFNTSNFLSAACIAYFARLSRANQFSVGFHSQTVETEIDLQIDKLYSHYVPFNIRIDLTWSFLQIYQAVEQQTLLINKNQTYPRDILARYPELNNLHAILPHHTWPIFLSSVDYFSQSPSTADFTILISEEENGWQWRYNTFMFDSNSIDNMSQQFLTLLDSITQTGQDTPFWNLDILTSAERHKLLVDWNQTDVIYSQKGQCIHHLFEAQVEQTPDAIALVYETEQLTYQELNERANQLAHHLQTLGVKPELPVGICLQRSLDLIIALLATLKAGGVYVPLNDTYPVNRLAFMLEDIETSLLLTHQELSPLFSDYTGKMVYLDEPTWHNESMINPDSSVTDSNLAYVIYTSGSTGKAKGVMINHHSLVNAYFAWKDAYQLRTTTNHLQMANFSFDVFSGDWVRALCSGGKLVICPYDTLLTPHKLYALLQEQEINCAEFVPAVFRPLLQHVEENGQNFEFMRVLIVASDNWYVGECDKIHQFCGPETRLINSYGLTEATIDSTYFDCDALYNDNKLRPDTSLDRLVPIGRPFANTKLYILDPYMQPVPVGIVGELYVGGAGLARGYLNRPKLTADRFIANIFNDTVDEQLYRTGDLARYLPDGNIEFLGRADYQVKIRGFRIELGEIETTLNNHPNIQTCVVVDRESNLGEKFLVAYIVPKQQPAPTSEMLRGFLKDKMPDYMIPPVFMPLLKLPLTSSGKINRQALPIPNHYSPENAKNYVAPCNPIEEVLVDIWANILMLDKVGVKSDFFALGGHSLLATRLLSWLHKTFQIKLPLRTLFEQPTIASQALLLIDHEQKQGRVLTIARLRLKVKSMDARQVQSMLRAKKLDPTV